MILDLLTCSGAGPHLRQSQEDSSRGERGGNQPLALLEVECDLASVRPDTGPGHRLSSPRQGDHEKCPRSTTAPAANVDSEAVSAVAKGHPPGTCCHRHAARGTVPDRLSLHSGPPEPPSGPGAACPNRLRNRRCR